MSKSFVILLAFLAFLPACDDALTPEPVRIRAECVGQRCDVWGIGRGQQTWRWFWNTYQMDSTLVVENIKGFSENTQDSLKHWFDFTAAAKVSYLFVVAIGESSDSLRLIATPESTTVAHVTR
jgi:hypothetical protein